MRCLPRREVASQHLENVVENHHSAPVHVAAHQSDSCGDNECLVVSPASMACDGEPLLHPRHCEPTDDMENEPEDVVHRLALDSCAIGGTEEVRLGSSRVARRVSCVWSYGIQRSWRCACWSDASLMKGVVTSRCNQECVLLRTFTVSIREREQ